MDDNEAEYRLPARVLTNRDPILMNRLSIREFLQWLFFFGLIYLGFNFLPFDFYIRMVIATCLGMFAFLFIHAPINGLGGIEWLYIWLRYRLEKRQHHTQPPYNLALVTSQRPNITVAMSLADRSKVTADETSNLYAPMEGEL